MCSDPRGACGGTEYTSEEKSYGNSSRFVSLRVGHTMAGHSFACKMDIGPRWPTPAVKGLGKRFDVVG